jgi:hypothetical protein
MRVRSGILRGRMLHEKARREAGPYEGYGTIRSMSFLPGSILHEEARREAGPYGGCLLRFWVLIGRSIPRRSGLRCPAQNSRRGT